MEWNVIPIRQHLPLYEDRILQIIPSSFNKHDELVWLPDASGLYNSKSGYELARKSLHTPVTSEYPWRKCIWNLNTAPKIQSFLWRALNGALPVGHTLLIRGLQAESRCKRCGETETPLHLFFSCPFAARVWEKVPALCKPNAGSVSTMRELLISNTRMINLPPTGLVSSPIYPWLYWHLWKNRNRLIFENKSWSEAELIRKVLYDARAWEEVSQAVKHPSPRCTRSALPTPELKGISCFTDGAWDPISGHSGQGWAFVNPAGDVIRHYSSNRLHVATPIVAEALAVKAAL